MQKRGCRICVIIVTFILIVVCNFISLPANNIAKADERLYGELELHFIDVGQGDCVLIKLPDGKNMIIDGGRPEYGEVVCEYLEKEDVGKIDYMVATHSDEDHVGGLISILDMFEVGTIVRPFDLCKMTTNSGFVDDLYLLFGQVLPEEQVVLNSTYATFLEKAYSETVNGSLAEIKVASDKLGFVSALADYPYLIKFYMPKGEEAFSTSRIINGYRVNQVEDKNETSAIIGLFTQKHKYLFCADATTNEEISMINNLSEYEKNELVNISLLKVSHHGANTGTSEQLINLTKPKYAIIMVGEDNDYGHPTNEVLDRLGGFATQIFRTDESGSIVVIEKGNVLEVKTTKKGVGGWLFYGLLIGTVVAVLVISVVFIITKKKKRENRINKIR